MDRPIDYHKLRVYLSDKYRINKAYYFLWFREKENVLYEKLQEAGFILVFNLKGETLKSNKKWNVDTNLVFTLMKKHIEEKMNGVVLISGDGDYKMMVDYLIEKKVFLKLLAPNLKYSSSLYRNAHNMDPQYFDYLDKPSIRNKIWYKKKAP